MSEVSSQSLGENAIKCMVLGEKKKALKSMHNFISKWAFFMKFSENSLQAGTSTNTDPATAQACAETQGILGLSSLVFFT